MSNRIKKHVTYPDGALLFDVKYYKKPECFEVIYLDPITQKLEVEYEQAIVDIWFLKEEFRTNDYQIAYASIDKCYPVYCKPSQIPRMIAENIGGEWKEYFDKNIETVGLLEKIKTIKTKKGDTMAFLELTDETGVVSATIFPNRILMQTRFPF